MKVYWGVEVQLHAFFDLGTRWVSSTSRPGPFTLGERDSDTHWIGDWVCPRAGLEAVVKRKISSPCQDSNPDHLIVRPVASRYTDWAIQGSNKTNVITETLNKIFSR
jgi:hypothetical protein